MSSSSSSEESSAPVEEASSSSSSESASSVAVSSGEEELFQVFPHRTLVSIASLTDLLVHPLSAPVGDLYRANTVAMIFRSKSHMEAVLEEVTEEVQTNARIQRIDIDNFEVIDLTDPGHGLDIDEDYFFL